MREQLPQLSKMSNEAKDDLIRELVEKIMEYIRSARLLGSDETSARVEGINHWEWVFQNEQVCLHVIRPSRGQKRVS